MGIENEVAGVDKPPHERVSGEERGQSPGNAHLLGWPEGGAHGGDRWRSSGQGGSGAKWERVDLGKMKHQ